MSGSVGGGGAAVCLASLAKLEGLSTKCTLVDLALLRARKWYAVVLELVGSFGIWHKSQAIQRTSTTVFGASRVM